MDREEWRRHLSETAIDPWLSIIEVHRHRWPVAPLPDCEAYTDETIITEMGGSGHMSMQAWRRRPVAASEIQGRTLRLVRCLL